MARGRLRADWDRAASILAQTANINRNPKKQKTPFDPVDFNPYRDKKQRRKKKCWSDQLRDLARAAGAKTVKIPVGRMIIK